PLADIAREAAHPERVVGMHFFSPVHRMQLVEVVRPAKASPEAVARAVAAGQALGKTVIVVRDGPGFYTTRVIGAMIGEATRMLNEGARIEDIDRAMTTFGWPVGPFTLMDEVGLAVASHAGETVATALGVASERNAVRGLGFPPFLGGPFRYADAQATALRDRLTALAERHGQRYTPATSIANGRRFFP